MDFDLNKEQEMIRREVRRFAEKEIAPVAAELDKREEFSADLTRKMGARSIEQFSQHLPESSGHSTQLLAGSSDHG